MDKRLAFILSSVVLLISAAILRPSYLHTEANPYHSRIFISAYGGLPDTLNSLFSGSGKCAGCHSTDPNFLASLVGQTFPAIPMPDARDVNPTDMWRSTIMANSAKDPFWRAKVSHEVAINPGHQASIEDKCTSCHAPLGNFAAAHDGIDMYSMEMLIADSLALDGVSCVACHQQSLDSSGISFSGQLKFDSAIIYGPYGMGKDDPPLYTLPMETYSNYVPMHGDHIVESIICADCHTLITHSVDLEGNFTGEMYVEQATYHEWLNSAFSGQGLDVPDEYNGISGTCQTCHMPRITEPVIISSGYAFLEPRTPYGLHTLVGANTAMLEIMRDNIVDLGLTATVDHFDSTIVRTRSLLESSLEIEFVGGGGGYFSWWESISAEGYGIDVKLHNKVGHKFPSGYPSRRLFVELYVVLSESGDTLFHSGKMDSSGARIIGTDDDGLSDYERHHDLIYDESQVQIYELVAANVNYDPTNVLEQAYVTVKDNRLVPKGFSMNHSAYDTTRVEGEVLFDDDFNKSLGWSGEVIAEGTGTDIITYAFIDPDFNLPNPVMSSEYGIVTVNVWYQSMPPRWVESMFDYDTQAIADFEELYNTHGSAAVLVATNTTFISGLSDVDELDEGPVLYLSPNPAREGETKLVWSNLSECSDYELFNSSGALIYRDAINGQEGSEMIRLPNAKGVYIVRVDYGTGVKSLRVVRD